MLVQLELPFSVTLFGKFRLILFSQQVVTHYEVIHFSSHKAAVSIFRTADHWLTPDVETRIIDHTVSRRLLGRLEEGVDKWRRYTRTENDQDAE